MDPAQQISEGIYPNALARLRVSLKDMSVEHLGSIEDSIGNAEGDNMATKKSSKKDELSNSKVDLMWKSLGLGKIDLSYACIGYTHDGRMVLNQDELVSLLINYGFMIQDVMSFIDDFAVQSAKDSKGPIVMYTVNTAAIMNDIEPIVDEK